MYKYQMIDEIKKFMLIRKRQYVVIFNTYTIEEYHIISLIRRTTVNATPHNILVVVYVRIFIMKKIIVLNTKRT